MFECLILSSVLFLFFCCFSLCLVGEKLEERNRRKYEKGKENVERVMFYLLLCFFILSVSGMFGGNWSSQFRGTVGIVET